MDRFHSLFGFGEVHDDRNLNLTGRDHIDVHTLPGERFKHFAGDAAVAFHSDAYDRELSDSVRGDHFAKADLLLQALDNLARLEQVRFIDGEREISRRFAAAMADVLDDHVHIDVGVANRAKNPGGDAGFVWYGHERYLGLIFVERDPAHDHAFHAFRFLFHDRSWILI